MNTDFSEYDDEECPDYDISSEMSQIVNEGDCFQATEERSQFWVDAPLFRCYSCFTLVLGLISASSVQNPLLLRVIDSWSM